jgi:hypothetical protein
VSLKQFSVLAGVTASLGMLTAPVSAMAQSGVHVDPGSPAGSEYAVPIQAARGDFGKQTDKSTKKTTTTHRSSQSSQSSGSSQSYQASQSEPAPAPFGVGITPAKPKPRGHAPAPQHVPKPEVTHPVAVSAEPRLPDVDAGSTVSPAAMTWGIVGGMLLVALAVVAVTRQPRRTRS